MLLKNLSVTLHLSGVLGLGMGEPPAPTLESLGEETRYWKELAAKHQQRYPKKPAHLNWSPIVMKCCITYRSLFRVILAFELKQNAFLFVALCSLSVTSAQEAHDELQEFQQMSRDYETELETELKQYETRNRELQSHNERLSSELDNIKVGHCSRRGSNSSCLFQWNSNCCI